MTRTICERFVAAQDSGGAYDRAVSELQDGRKVSHWIWFVFPQIAGLGPECQLEGVRHLVTGGGEGLPGPSRARTAADRMRRHRRRPDLTGVRSRSSGPSTPRSSARR